MGSFSWKFADRNNASRLRVGKKGYIATPDGKFIKELSYEGYGKFAGQDVYELVVAWNRDFIATHPDFLLPHVHTLNTGDKNHPNVKKIQKKLSDFPWYPIVANLSIKTEDIVSESQKTRALEKAWMYGLRGIGIDIACYYDDNSSLPYPIKITQTMEIPYAELPASQLDPDQGF